MTIRSALWLPGSPGHWTNVHDKTTVTPPPPPTGFQFTVLVGGNGVDGRSQEQLYNSVRAKLGRDLGGRIKFFDYGNGINTALTNQAATPSSTEPLPMFCIKLIQTAALNTWLDTLTTDAKKCILVWDQEFYSTSQTEWDTYNANYLTLKNLLAAHTNGARVRLQAVSSMSQHRNNPGFFAYVDEANITYWGADTYNAKANAYTAVQCFEDQRIAFETMKANNPNLKWHIAEYGLSRLKDPSTSTYYTGPERVAKMQAHIDWLLSHDCSGLAYWAVDNSSAAEPVKDWSIDKGSAADDYFAAYLADLLDAYPMAVF